MAKAKKKTKKIPYHMTHHHHNASNNLLLILAGGFIVIVGSVYILSSDKTDAKPQYHEVVAAQEVEKVTEEIVTIEDSAYAPQTITVKVGTKVTWMNNDLEAHSATADDGSFDTGVMQSGEKGSVVFDKPGTYEYYCIPHPNMRGKVVVEE